MQVAILTLYLNETFDAVCYDSLYQYRSLSSLFGEKNVKLFALDADEKVYQHIPVGNAAAFDNWCAAHPHGTIIFHYCDSKNVFDVKLRALRQTVVIRWHNNTPPWFNLDNSGQAIHAQIGYENLIAYIDSHHVRFWANSEFSQQQLLALGCAAGRIEVVYPGSRFLDVDIPPAPPSLTTKSTAAFNLLFVGRIVPHKGHLNAIATASALQQLSSEPVRMHFIGKRDPGMQRFNMALDKQIAESKVEIVEHGQVSSDELARLYSESDCFLCLSEHEGFGLPVFEAFRAGLPVVAWATSAFKELLDGHPFAFTHFHPQLYAAALASLKDAQNSKFVLNTQANLAIRYSHEVLQNQLQDAMSTLGSIEARKNLVVTNPSLANETELESALLSHLNSLVEQFPNQDHNLVHDSGSNLVSLLDLEHYRTYFERERARRFAPLASLDDRLVQISPIEQSFRGGHYLDGKLSWPHGRYDGCILWGPYMHLLPGEYVARFQLRTIDRGGRGSIRLDVHSTKGLAAERDVPISALRNGRAIDVPFAVLDNEEWYEFRLSALNSFEGSLEFEGVTLRNRHLELRGRPVEKELCFFEPLAQGTMSRSKAEPTTLRLSPLTSETSKLYSETFMLPPGEHILDVQLGLYGQVEDRLDVTVNNGSDIIATTSYQAGCLAFRPLRIKLSQDDKRNVTLSLHFEGNRNAYVEYAGFYLLSRSSKSSASGAFLDYLPAFLAKRRATNAAKLGNYAEAASAFECLIKKRALGAGEWIQYGHSLKELGDGIGAELAYHRAVSMQPENYETLLHLAHLYIKINRREKARYFFEYLISSSMYEDEARTALRNLSKTRQ